MGKSEFDAVIIGAGTGGGATAWGLTRYGFKVLVIEAGPAYSPSEYNLDKPNWEQSDFPDRSKHKERYTLGTFQKLGTELTEIRSWNQIDGHMNKVECRIAYRPLSIYSMTCSSFGNVIILPQKPHFMLWHAPDYLVLVSVHKIRF